MATIRRYFALHGVLEVDTPLMSHAGTVDRHIDSIACAGNRWLHTSPEFAMKRLVAAGIGSCFQICHVFREDPSSALHEPEFTLLEWYRVGFDLNGIMDDTESLFAALGVAAAPWTRRTWRDVMEEQLRLDPLEASAHEIERALQRHNVLLDVDTSHDDARDVLLDAAMGLVVAPSLGRDGPCIVHHYPASQAALARLDETDPGVAQRFEVFWRGVELANGYHELTHAGVLEERFSADHDWRMRRSKATPPYDGALVAALEAGLPDCAGVAVGLDRLLMQVLRLGSVAETMPFAGERA